MNKAERQDYQKGLETDAEGGRPNIPPSERPSADSKEFCGASRTGRHDFTMRGPDKKYRCWHCVKTRAEVEAQP